MAKNVYFGAGGNHRVKAITFRAGSNRKVIRGWIGIGGANRLFFDDSIEIGHYWLIDADGTKEYSANGTLVKSSSTKTSWTCPSAGNYSIELHASGGRGGSGDGDNDFQMIFGNPSWTAAAAGGGGGGGSGCIVKSVYLDAKEYTIAIDVNQQTSFSINDTESIYVKDGSIGNSGTADAFGVPSATGGHGGSPGLCSNNATQLSSNGGTGGQYAIGGAYASADGGYGGTGGSTIGNYGDGGDGGSATQNGGNSGQFGRPGAIIIRKL